MSAPLTWTALLRGEMDFLRLPWGSQRKVLCYITCELHKDGNRKSAENIKRGILAYHFDGDDTRPGAYIAALLVQRPGRGLTSREREAGNALLSALRADPIAHVAEINRRVR